MLRSLHLMWLAISLCACSLLFDPTGAGEGGAGDAGPSSDGGSEPDAGLGDSDPDGGLSPLNISIGIIDGFDDAVVELGSDPLTTHINGLDLDLNSAHVGGAFDHRTVVALRFVDLPIPQGTVLTEAYLQFTAQEDYGGGARMAIKLEDTLDAPSLLQAQPTVISRSDSVIGSQISWPVTEPWIKDASGALQQTPSILAPLQTLIDRPLWQEGNAIVLFIVSEDGGEGTRPVYSFEGTSFEEQVPHLIIR